MRPVNLIPPEQRRGESAPTRTGALAYIVVGVLAVVLAGVAGVTLLGKQVNDREAQVAALEQQQAEVEARAQSLASFSQFQQVKDTRAMTIAALAQSRFDWERVMRELSLVIPPRIWLVNLTGSVTPDAHVQNEAGVTLRVGAAGPALEMIGCGRSQRDVARFIAALSDIDGVTRVTAARSEKSDTEVTDTAAESDATTDECRTRDFITRFEIVAAFDAVPVPAGAAPVPAAPTGTEGSTATPTSDDGGVGAAENQQAAAAQSVDQAGQKVDQAAGIAGGTG